MENNQKNKITPALVAAVRDMLSAKEEESNIRKYIRTELKLGKSRGNEIFNEIKNSIDDSEKYGLEFISDNKIYNVDSDKYIIRLKCRKEPLVIDGAKHRAICRAYSSMGENLTCHEICVNFSLTPEIFNEYRKIFSLVKEKEPLSEEEVVNNTINQSVESVLEQKRYTLYQEFEKADWKLTQAKAKQWDQFQYGSLDPFSRFLDSWNPPAYKSVKCNPLKYSEKVAVINVNDIHVGAKADKRFLYRQRNWRHEDLVDSMTLYVAKIRQDMHDRKTSPGEAVLCIQGDILHTLTGFTDAGTKLEYEFIGEDQIDFSITLLTSFINELLTVFPKISVKSVNGNHSYLGDYIVSKILSIYYRHELRINFEITSARYLPFKVLNTLFILDHGASGKGIKSKMPRTGPTRDAYIKGLFLDRPELLSGINSRIFVTADTHHYEHIEKSDFELIVCPSIVAGDIYSDFSGWKSRPSQSIFIVDEDGLKETIRFYFD